MMANWVKNKRLHFLVERQKDDRKVGSPHCEWMERIEWITEGEEEGEGEKEGEGRGDAVGREEED